MQKLLLAILLTVSAQAAYYPAQAEPVVPPALVEDFKGVEFAVKATGSAPLAYQWYVKTGRTTLKVPENDTAQTATLELSPPYIVGTYWCEISNKGGTIKSKTFQLSETASKSAADMKTIIKKP